MEKMKRKVTAVLIPLLLIASLASNSLTFGVEKTLNVGIIGPQGLPLWSPGGMWNGAQLAASEINAAGGIHIGGDTYMINLIPENEHSYPTIDTPAAVAAIANLIGLGAKLIIGGFNPGVTGPMLSVVKDAQVPFFINGAATSALVDLTTPEKYASDKYIFRVMPQNDTALLVALVNYLRCYLLPEKLNKIYGYDLDDNPATPNQTRIAVIAEQTPWANTMYYALTNPSIYPSLLGPYANVSYAGTIDPYTVTDTTPWLDAAAAAQCRLLITIFYTTVGQNLIIARAQGGYNMIPVGINVMSQFREHWYTTSGGCEYEVVQSMSGTETHIVPGLTDVFWKNFIGNYSTWPVYTAFGAYDTLYVFQETLESINPADIAAVQDYLDGGPTSSDVLIPYFEQTDRMALNGRFTYTSGIYGPGTGHDVFSNELSLTSVLGYSRPLMCQWINGNEMNPPVSGGVLTVVCPIDQPFSRKTQIPPWMYPLALRDINFDGVVDIEDIHIVCLAFGTKPGEPRWNMEADVNLDGKVDILDINIVGQQNYIDDVAVTNLKSAKAVICQGYCGNLTVTIQNQGNFTENFDVTVYANTTIMETKEVTLTSGNSTTAILTWNTTGFAKGNYTIKATADTVPWEIDIEDNNMTGGWVIVAMVGDLVGTPDGYPDGMCDMKDIRFVAKRFGIDPYNTALWDPNADVIDDNYIDMKDIRAVAKHFGETDP